MGHHAIQWARFELYVYTHYNRWVLTVHTGHDGRPEKCIGWNHWTSRWTETLDFWRSSDSCLPASCSPSRILPLFRRRSRFGPASTRGSSRSRYTIKECLFTLVRRRERKSQTPPVSVHGANTTKHQMICIGCAASSPTWSLRPFELCDHVQRIFVYRARY